MTRTWLSLPIALALLAPVAIAHEARDLPAAREGTALAAPFLDEELREGPPLFDTAAAELSLAIPGGRIAAAHDGRDLVLDVLTRTPGWFVVAIDDADERATHLVGAAARVQMFEAQGASAADVPDEAASRGGALGVFSATIDGGSHAHGADASGVRSTWGGRNAWIQWQPPAPDDGAAVVERTHSGTVLRFSFPESAIGAGLEHGRVVRLLVYHGDAPVIPPGPFLSEERLELAEITLYPASRATSIGSLAQLSGALDGRSDLAGGVLPLAGVTLLALVALALSWRPGSPPPVRARRRPPLPYVPLLPPGAGRAAAVVALLAAPSMMVAHPVAAQAPEVAPSFIPPIFEARDPCGIGSPVRSYHVSAIDMDIIFNRWGDHDPEGMMYVLDEERDAVRAERAALQPVLEGDQTPYPNGTMRSLMTPLVLRAQLGECVEVRLTNRLDRVPPQAPGDPLGAGPPHAPLPSLHGLPPVPASALPLPGPEERRASMHVHGLPLDPTVSGGDTTGYNPETSVGVNQSIVYRVGAARKGVFFFHDHADPTSAGNGAFPALDEAFRGGTVHGLFGALVVEPPGARWTDPFNGTALRSGWKADIHVPGQPSFREFVISYHDPQLVARDGGAIREPMTDHGLNYRVETLSHRIFDDKARCPADAARVENRGVNPCEDISLVYASNVHGDPGTPIPRAYMGDPTKIRLVHAGMEETHAHHLHGHRWQAMDGDPASTRIDSQTLSPSETFTETLEAGAGGEGVAHAPGDYIYHCHLFPHLYGGMWSFFRVHDRLEVDLVPLPATSVPAPSAGYRGFPHFIQEVSTPGFRPHRAPQTTGIDPTTGMNVAAVGSPYTDVCPPGAPSRRYRLAAIELPVRYNHHGDFDPSARIFVLAEDVPAVLANLTRPVPPVLRIRQGECMTITLENHLPVSGDEVPIRGFGKVSIHTHLLEYDVLGADGTSTGWIFDQTIWQNETITYRFYADRDLQTIVWHDHAAGLETAFKGIYGATLVEPPGAEFRDPRSGRPLYNTGANGADGVFDSARDPITGKYSELWRADIVGRSFRDFREFFASVQDFANLHNAAGRPYRDQTGPLDFADFGLMAFNFRSEPLWHRLGNGTNITNSTRDVFASTLHGDPATNLWEAYAGDRTILRLHQVAYEEIHSFQLNGHRWRFGYKDANSPLVSAQTIGISEAFNAYLDCGAGGCTRSPGDYLYRSGGIDDVWAGGWGLFRVHGSQVPDLRRLPDAPRAPAPASNPCPRGARDRWFDVVAIEDELVYNGYGDHDQYGRALVLAHEEPLVREGLLEPKPLTLRVTKGDCVHLRLTNHLPEWSLPHAAQDPQPTAGFLQTRNGPEITTGNLLKREGPAPSNHVGLHVATLSYRVRDSDGGKVGYNPDTTVAPGGTRMFTYYADIPAPGAVLIEDLGDVLQNRHHGLFGGIVVLPPGAVALDPDDGLKVWNDPVADVETIVYRSLGQGWRDIVVFNQNGLALAQPTGFPLALPGAHTADVNPEVAAQLALAALRDFVPGGATRATIADVAPGPSGFIVLGELEDAPFEAQVHRREGLLLGIEFFPHGAPSASYVDVRTSSGDGVAGLLVNVSWQAQNSTDVDGVARFYAHPRRGEVEIVRLPALSSAFEAWSDSERRLGLSLRVASAAGIPLAASAGAAGLAFLRTHDLPAGPLGLEAVDVTGTAWRVRARDALRSYEVALDPGTLAVLGMSVQSYAQPSSPPWTVSRQEAQKVASGWAREHFGTNETPIHLAQSRFGVWQIDLGTPTNATAVGIDGATGRILYAYRGRATSTPTPLVADDDVLLHFRADDETPLDGTLIQIKRGALTIHSGQLKHGGRFVVPDSVIGAERSTGLRAVLPTRGLDLPLALGPDGKLLAEFHGVSSTSPIDLSEAVELARLAVAGLAGGDSLALRADFGVAGAYHGSGAWDVSLASGDSLATFHIDDRTGKIHQASLAPWATPKDECSGEVVEHSGPHPSPACRWSFSSQDEEDQGLHAYNYRAEPLEERLNRVPDPAFAFSSRVHGENGAPVWEAHAGDVLTMHVVGANDKARVSAFSVSGHAWPREPQDPRSTPSQGQGGLAPGSTHTLRMYGGAGGRSGLAGDYLVQGAVQRQTAEAGEWGILRVLPGDDPSLLSLLDRTRLAAASTALLAQREIPIGAATKPCDGARATVQVWLERDAAGASRARASGAPQVQAGTSIPIRVDMLSSREVGLRVVDLQARASNASVREIVGSPTNTRIGAPYCVYLDIPVSTQTATLGLEIFSDLDDDGMREILAASIPVEVERARTPASPPPASTPPTSSTPARPTQRPSTESTVHAPSPKPTPTPPSMGGSPVASEWPANPSAPLPSTSTPWTGGEDTSPERSPRPISMHLDATLAAVVIAAIAAARGARKKTTTRR